MNAQSSQDNFVPPHILLSRKICAAAAALAVWRRLSIRPETCLLLLPHRTRQCHTRTRQAAPQNNRDKNIIPDSNLALKISLHALGSVWQAADKKGTICGGASCESGASGDPGGSGSIKCLPSLNSPHMKRCPKSKLFPYHWAAGLFTDMSRSTIILHVVKLKDKSTMCETWSYRYMWNYRKY